MTSVPDPSTTFSLRKRIEDLDHRIALLVESISMAHVDLAVATEERRRTFAELLRRYTGHDEARSSPSDSSSP
jgi:hypothetical protein